MVATDAPLLPRAAADTGIAPITMLPNDRINPIFEATVQATEETIISAMLRAAFLVPHPSAVLDVTSGQRAFT